MIKTLFSQIDFFKSPIVLYYNGHLKRTSPVGIVLSLFILAFLAYQFFTSDFFAKTSPYVIQQDEQEALAPPLYFNRRNPLYFSVFEATTLKKMVDPTLFTITVIYYDNYVQVEKEVGPCTLEDVVLDPKTFEALGYNSLYCIKNSTFVLSGYPDEPTFNFLEVMLFVCDNLTSNGTCKSPDEISAFFVGKAFAFGYQRSQINFHDYQNPFVVTYDIINNYLD